MSECVQHFNNFLKTFVIEKKSYIREKEKEDFVSLSSLNGGSFDFNTINATYANFCNASKKNDKGKEKKIGEIDFNNFKDIEIEILNHAIFLWGLPNKGKPSLVLTDSNKDKYKEMPTCAVGRAGQGYNGKLERVRFILYIFTQVFAKQDVNAIKDEIKNICKKKNYQYNDNNITYDVPSDLRNFLLHLCYPKDYSPIATDADKERIVNAFAEGIEEIEESDDIDTKIKKIRNEIKKDNPQNSKIKIIQKITGKYNDYPFYEKEIIWLWKNESYGKKLSRVQLLDYKKAMVLYGPPGTSKTYNAMELAKEMLICYWFKQYENETDPNKKDDYLKKILQIAEISDDSKKENTSVVESAEVANVAKKTDTPEEQEDKKNIYYLQFHVNYSYENFIAGQVIEEGKGIVTKKGFIYDVIKKANDNLDVPFVVILDELNRVDVSRVFGELFTAIEKRGTEVVLTLPDPDHIPTTDKPNKRLTLTIPENVYFIGTMNEIDFSLEQIDFALRRRFIWELAGYDPESLEDIISSRFDKFSEDSNINYSIDSVTISNFIKCCNELNNNIKDKKELGEEYHIGHAFFAEIVEITIKIVGDKKNKKLEGNKKREVKISDSIWNNAKNILWQISIQPTLDAYCGTMGSDKEGFIKECENIFINNGKSKDKGL